MYYAIVVLIMAFTNECRSKSVVNIQSVVLANDEFTAKIYKELVKTSRNENIIVSGLSANIILSLLANGAKGTSKSEVLSGLNLPNNLELINKAYEGITSRLKVNTEDLKLISANKMFPAKGFPILKPFNDIAVNFYEAGVENVDYSSPQIAANTINDWTKAKTNDKIQQIIDPSELDAATALILVNALYFSGKWSLPYGRDYFHVRKGNFYTSATDSKEIDTMYTETSTQYCYNENLKTTFLELGFLDGDVSMTFVLPDNVTGLATLEEDLGEYLKPQKMKRARIGITIPKFKIESKIDFKPILQSFGINAIFSDSSDLSGISNAGPLKVDAVVQKAFIDVNEEGVEAAAATGYKILLLSLPPKVQYYFNADHPFVFYIRDNNSGLTLFAGRFMQ